MIDLWAYNLIKLLTIYSEQLLGAVGAVAIDSSGHVACATSTGITGKAPGRVGDTPLAGAGGYCDDLVGGCSATGQGEAIARVCLLVDPSIFRSIYFSFFLSFFLCCSLNVFMGHFCGWGGV